MVVFEGKGIVSPKPVRIGVNRDELRTLRREAEVRSTFRNYAYRTDRWGKSLMDGEAVRSICNEGETIPAAVLAILVGMVGEYALCRHINSCFGRTVASLDLKLRRKGDRGKDLQLFGNDIQIKTRKWNYRKNYIRVRDESGGRVIHIADLYVFCEWKLFEHVDLLGWADLGTVRDWNVMQSPKFGHHNLCGKDSDLKPISRLIDRLKADRDTEK